MIKHRELNFKTFVKMWHWPNWRDILSLSCACPVGLLTAFDYQTRGSERHEGDKPWRALNIIKSVYERILRWIGGPCRTGDICFYEPKACLLYLYFCDEYFICLYQKPTGASNGVEHVGILALTFPSAVLSLFILHVRLLNSDCVRNNRLLSLWMLLFWHVQWCSVTP